jgi:hypothetical protein
MRDIARGFLLVLGLVYICSVHSGFRSYCVNRYRVRPVEGQEGSGNSVLDFGPCRGGFDGVAKSATTAAGAA